MQIGKTDCEGVRIFDMNKRAGAGGCTTYSTSKRHIILPENVLGELLQSNYAQGRDLSPTLQTTGFGVI